MDEAKIIDRLARMEEKVDNIIEVNQREIKQLYKKIYRLEEKNEILQKMQVLLEVVVEDSKKHAEQMERFEQTMLNVNDNLSMLNKSQIDTREDMARIDKRLEKVEEGQEKGSINIPELMRDVIKNIILALVAYGLVKLGIG